MGARILDSMGLGKTVETLAVMCCIKAWKQTRLPFLVCVPRGLVDQWTEEIFAHTSLGRFGDGVTSYVDMDRHSLNPDYDSIASHSVILTTRNIILSEMKQVYKKAQEGVRFSSALFPGLTEYDAACVIVSGHGKLRNEIAHRYPEIVNPFHPSYRSFHESSWVRSSEHWPDRFAALVVDEAHQLRNAAAPTTRAVCASPVLLLHKKCLILLTDTLCPKAPVFDICSPARPSTTASRTSQRCRGCYKMGALGRTHCGGGKWRAKTGRQGGRDLRVKVCRQILELGGPVCSFAVKIG